MGIGILTISHSFLQTHLFRHEHTYSRLNHICLIVSASGRHWVVCDEVLDSSFGPILRGLLSQSQKSMEMWCKQNGVPFLDLGVEDDQTLQGSEGQNDQAGSDSSDWD
ncbi:OLC1v1030659C1 [Oldenlandia corymbosa var. corymbosa]|uniref:OLC1v1030659C1 n=1 Tax=Oldenlandia corymbosa var. corymbosa TaxID=529605 RepID=A0AAV1CIG5_OLDCO|nr:OLC1v1030659C1 [Oldenlandia corymbosa var. corymbosa]